MNKILALIVVMALGGCTTTSDVYLKNGEQGLTIDCSGEANSWASCYEKADASCAGTGYRIVGTEGTPALKESEKNLGPRRRQLQRSQCSRGLQVSITPTFEYRQT